MQEHVKPDQIATEDDDGTIEPANIEHRSVFLQFGSSQDLDQLGEPGGSISDINGQTTHDAFVPMSMSSMNSSVRDALLGETQPGRDTDCEGIDSNIIEQGSSQVRSSTKGECKMKSRYKRSAVADDGKHKRSRTTFNAAQINALEKIFQEQQYPDQQLREKIAERLEMEEQKVVIWFQNRRAKYKRTNRSDHVNITNNTLVRAPIQDTNSFGGLQTIERQSVPGANFKLQSQHVNVNGTYTANQQTAFQDGGIQNSYHFDRPTQILHAGMAAGTVSSTSQEQCTLSRDTNDVRANTFRLPTDGFTSSPEPVTSSVDNGDAGDVSSTLKPVSTLKPDKPLIQEPPPNQICTNAGSQNEMRQALMQWRTRLNMAANTTFQQQTINSLNSFSSKIPNTLQHNLSLGNTYPQIDRPSQFQDDIYDETYVSSSSSSSSCSEIDEDGNDLMNLENKQFTHKSHPAEHHRINSSNIQGSTAFNNAPALNQPTPLYLDIPSVSSGDMSSPSPHSATSSTSWPSSDLSSVDPSSPVQFPSSQFDNQKPVPNIPQFNNSAPTGVNWSGECNEAQRKPTYESHVTNPYADDILLPPLRDVELPMQRCRRRLKWRRIRREERRKYPIKTNRHNKDTGKYMHYNGNMETHVKRQERWGSREGMIHGGQREAFISDNFMSISCQRQNSIRPQCKYAQQVSTYHTEQQYERQKHHQRQSKRRHVYNHRLQYPDNPEYSQGQMSNQSIMGATAEELRPSTKLQKTDTNANLNGFRFNEYCSSSSSNTTEGVIPSKQPPLMFTYNGGNSARHGKSLNQHRNGVSYPQAIPEWNNPIMEVHVPIPPRRPRHPQPPRVENGATSGVVHHYGDTEELDITPFQIVESVSDLSPSLNADQSAALNRVLESVVKDIFPFSDNFISM